MIERPYSKRCEPAKLVKELLAAGLVQDPNVGARFYGVTYDAASNATCVCVYDDLTAAEAGTIDGIVAAHVYTAPAAKYSPEIFLSSADGSAWKITVDNLGVLSTTKVT